MMRDTNTTNNEIITTIFVMLRSNPEIHIEQYEALVWALMRRKENKTSTAKGTKKLISRMARVQTKVWFVTRESRRRDNVNGMYKK